MIAAVRARTIRGPCDHAKRLALGVFVRILLPLIHLLLELLRLLLVGERQAGETLLELESVEECAVLVVLEGIVDLLIPYDAAIQGRDVNQFDPERVSHEVVGQDGGTLKAGVGPSVLVGVGNVELGDSDGVDLVGTLRDGPLDRLLVVVGQYRRHGGGAGGRSFGLRGSRSRDLSTWTSVVGQRWLWAGAISGVRHKQERGASASCLSRIIRERPGVQGAESVREMRAV